MATGLLVMGVGRATRLLRFLGDLPKTYEGTFRLGVETDTLDADGEVVAREDAGDVTRDAVRAAMARSSGASAQRPPAYCGGEGRRPHAARGRARGRADRGAPRRIVRVDRFDSCRCAAPRSGSRATVSSAAPTCGSWPPTSATRSGAGRT